MKLKEIAVAFLIVSLVGAAQPALAAPVLAQEHRKVVDRAAVDQALALRVQADDASRASIRALLQRDVVRQMAGDLGLEVRRAESAVATLQGAQLQRVAQQAAVANDLLAGGAQKTIQISIVTLLLIIIIVILLAG